MSNGVRGLDSGRIFRSLFGTAPAGRVVVVAALVVLAGPSVLAHSPNMDAVLSDWCVGAPSNTVAGRTEDSGSVLECGNCDSTTDLACENDGDCPGGESCINMTSKTETAWWDNRTDGAVNDLATVAMTFDNDNLYIAAELWVDPDPESLPFGEVAIDFTSGGTGIWHDPSGGWQNGVLTNPGNCSVSTDRTCSGEIRVTNPNTDTNMDGVGDIDCHFCTVSREPTGGCSVTTQQTCATDSNCPGAEVCLKRFRTCGSGCDPLNAADVCNTTQTCQNIGTVARPFVGQYSAPAVGADHLVVFDFSLWLIGIDAVLLMQPAANGPQAPWVPVTGCTPDFVGDNTNCDFVPVVNPGFSGGSGGPPGSVEVAIPWSAFGCTGCPGACVCPGFGPGQNFRFTMMVARGNSTLDLRPDFAIEDVLSEPMGMTSKTTNSCAGFGSVNTACEISDDSQDAYIPAAPAFAYELNAGGRAGILRLSKAAAAQITLDWGNSCSAIDSDFALYEGTIGTWTSHLRVAAVGGGGCAVGGNTATFNPGAGNRYYLVVPTAGSSEGSYGANSSGAERPASTVPCAGQVLGNCY